MTDLRTVDGPKGAVAAFKVDCGRERPDEITFYYAPSVGHYVIKESRSVPDQPARVNQLIAYDWQGVDTPSPRVTVARGNKTPVIRAEAEVEGTTVTEQVAQVTTTVRGVPVEPVQSAFAVTREELPPATPQPTDIVFTPPPAELPGPVQVAAATPARPAPAPAPAERRTIYRLVKSPPPIPLPPVPRAKPLPAGASDEPAVRLAAVPKPAPAARKRPRLAAARPSPLSTRTAVIKRADRALAVVKEAQASTPATTQQIERTRAWALETTGMADESMLAVAGVDKQVAKVGQKAAKPKTKRHKKVASLAPTPKPAAPARLEAEDDKLFAVHLASYRNPRRAYRGWQQIAARHPKLLRSLKPRIRRHDLGWKGVYYRLQVVPFAHRKAAGKLCDRLKARERTAASRSFNNVTTGLV